MEERKGEGKALTSGPDLSSRRRASWAGRWLRWKQAGWREEGKREEVGPLVWGRSGPPSWVVGLGWVGYWAVSFSFLFPLLFYF